MTRLHPRDVDDRIVAALRAAMGARLSVAQVAVTVGVSEGAARRSLQRLRADAVVVYKRLASARGLRRRWYRLSDAFTQELA